jgi:hypothetical protein
MHGTARLIKMTEDGVSIKVSCGDIDVRSGQEHDRSAIRHDHLLALPSAHTLAAV